MGSHFTLGLIHNQETEAYRLLNMGLEEINRIEQLLSEFITESDTFKINSNSENAKIEISRECYDLIVRSGQITELSGGCFDITVGPLKQLYSFKKEFFEMPDKVKIETARSKTGFSGIILDDKDKTIRFNKPGMRISFAAIGKGYASDMVKKIWLKEGVTSGYINASGDLNAFGVNEKGELWNIGISDPENKSRILLNIPLTNASVATSGDYEQHFIYNGVKYSHNIDPRTGIPVMGIKSVTVFSPAAELSDALATAVYVKGVVEGIDFINQLPQTHAIIIDEKNKIHLSKDLEYEQR